MLNSKISLVALVAALGASVANAEGPKNTPFLGVDVQTNYFSHKSDISYLDLDQNLNGASIFGGYRWKQFGAELGYTVFQHVKYTGNLSRNGVTILAASLTEKNYNAYLDGQYFHPLTQNLELKAIVGLGLLTTKLDGNFQINDDGFIASGSRTNSETQLGVRVGAGLQYNFNKHWAASLMYRFQTGNDWIKNVNTGALGVAYHF